MIFDWFVLSMRMQVILESLFARPGSAPIGAGRKESFGTAIIFRAMNFSKNCFDLDKMRSF